MKEQKRQPMHFSVKKISSISQKNSNITISTLKHSDNRINSWVILRARCEISDWDKTLCAGENLL
jgi:hypothetical protein